MKNHRPPEPAPTAEHAAPPRATAPSAAILACGAILLGVSLVATLLLVLEHLVGLALPGCGPGSACAQAAASVWGKVPGIGWPVSHLGFAYFAGLLVAWLMSGRGVSPALAMVARLGALVSVFYLFVIIFGGYACKYCLAAHAGNLAFWVLVEWTGARGPRTFRPVAVTAGLFVATTLVLAVFESRQKEIVAAKGEKDLAESTQAIIAATSQKAAQPGASQPAPGATTERPWKGCFSGRHVRGPAKAPIRLVIISDYQCPDCKRTEEDVKALLARRSDVSVAMKHFPMCVDCNPKVARTLHPNACWAARAAETAAILRGEDGFWEMHNWLFERRGAFTDAEFHAGLKSLNYDPAEFIKIMASQTTLDLVQQDIREADWLGLHYTPMVFINGVELKGVFAPQAVSRAIDALAATNPPALGCEVDQPPPAAEKYISDWRERPEQPIARSPRSWPMGPDDARLRILVWGDYQEPNTQKVDAKIRAYVGDRKDVQYTFRPYPIHPSCNPYSQLQEYIQGCVAAKGALAAGMLGGQAAYWKMHDWLLAHQADFSEEAMVQAAAAQGLDAVRFRQTLGSQPMTQMLFEEVRDARMMNLTQVPTIYLNNKYVPRWHREGDDLLPRLLKEADASSAGRP